MTSDFERCFQVMDCDYRLLLDEWMANWSDIVEFEVISNTRSMRERASASTGVTGQTSSFFTL